METKRQKLANRIQKKSLFNIDKNKQNISNSMLLKGRKIRMERNVIQNGTHYYSIGMER